jgi:formylglycine-generating enzyme required for sulfatase activity
VGDDYPVSNINWYDVVKWCNARSEKEGKTPVYMSNGVVYKMGQVTPTEVASANGYRLPREAEWEFAARGGTQTQGYTYSGSNDLNSVGWYGANSNDAAHQVGLKQANELGIFDMSGNLWEYCWDLYDSSTSDRRHRGGAFANDESPNVTARLSYRGHAFHPYNNHSSLGFRVALSSVPEMVLVSGGTLPASSGLGALPVDTFYIGKTEVTWSEWQTVRAWAVTNGYTDLANVGTGIGDNYPVTTVNWHDVVKWCNARSEKQGRTPVYMTGASVYRTGTVSDPQVVSAANGYRLPTEAEWEFAARGGTQRQGYTYSGSNDLNAVGWYTANSGDAVKEVGKKLANELGIFDMSGNFFEWCGSWYPGQEGNKRVIRGGAFYYLASSCTVSYRDYIEPVQRYNHSGFRVALSSVP